MSWIAENKDWIFSGIGVVFITGICGVFFRKKNGSNSDKKPNQSIKSGDNSNNIQGSNNVNVTIGDKNVQK